jgi:hypothetical protein
MASWTLFKIATLLTALVMVGEALALTVGLHVFGLPRRPWGSTKNYLLVVLDIVSGLGLGWIAWRSGDAGADPWFWLLLAVASHGFREWEYLTRAHNAFLFHAPLFVVNNAKLLGLLISAASRLL